MTSHDRQLSLSDILKLDPARAARLRPSPDDGHLVTRELSPSPVVVPDIEQLRLRDRQQLAQLREDLAEETETRCALERHLVELQAEVAELRLAGVQSRELSVMLEALRQKNEAQEAQLRHWRRLFREYQESRTRLQALARQTNKYRTEVARLRQQLVENGSVETELSVERQKRQIAERLLHLSEDRAEELQRRVNELEKAWNRRPLSRVRAWIQQHVLVRKKARGTL